MPLYWIVHLDGEGVNINHQDCLVNWYLLSRWVGGMGRGSIEHAWLAVLERTAKSSLCLSGSMSFVHKRVCPRSRDCRTDKTPASEEQELLFGSKANCLMSKVFFLSFFLCLSNVWNFDDGNVILRAIFKILRNWLIIVLRMNSVSIKFTLNVSSKNLNHSLHCKEPRPHGIT